MTLLDSLASLVDEAAEELPQVSRRRMFGCDAWFAGDAIFGLVWKEGRIGVKLPDEAAYGELMGHEGAAPWTAGSKKMSGWVFVPEEFHDDPDALAVWVKRAHAFALAAPPKPPKKPAAAKSGKAANSTKPAAATKAARSARPKRA